jgi:hypothetical protein
VSIEAIVTRSWRSSGSAGLEHLLPAEISAA